MLVHCFPPPHSQVNHMTNKTSDIISARSPVCVCEVFHRVSLFEAFARAFEWWIYTGFWLSTTEEASSICWNPNKAWYVLGGHLDLPCAETFQTLNVNRWSFALCQEVCEVRKFLEFPECFENVFTKKPYEEKSVLWRESSLASFRGSPISFAWFRSPKQMQGLQTTMVHFDYFLNRCSAQQFNLEHLGTYTRYFTSRIRLGQHDHNTTGWLGPDIIRCRCCADVLVDGYER